MNPKYNHYKITLENTHNPKGEVKNQPITLAFDNHDDIFNIIQKLQEKDHFNDVNQSAEFAIGLKMFGEVLLRNKDNALFEELLPAFKEFMKKLKSSGE